MPDPFQIFTALVVGIAAFVMLSLALLSYIHSRSVGEDVLKSMMYLKSHLLRRGYFIFIFVSAGMFLLGVPIALGADIPTTYYPIVAIFVMAGLDLAVLYFYFLVAPRKSPLTLKLQRLAGLLGGLQRDDQRRNAR